MKPIKLIRSIESHNLAAEDLPTPYKVTINFLYPSDWQRIRIICRVKGSQGRARRKLGHASIIIIRSVPIEHERTYSFVTRLHVTATIGN